MALHSEPIKAVDLDTEEKDIQWQMCSVYEPTGTTPTAVVQTWPDVINLALAFLGIKLAAMDCRGQTTPSHLGVLCIYPSGRDDRAARARERERDRDRQRDRDTETERDGLLSDRVATPHF